ncbi:MAG: WG repeat-containing protein [Flavitalea sp.]
MQAIKIFFTGLLICLISLLATAQPLKPGDISPGAKTIEADNIFPFYNGAAAIVKGMAYALIDKDGNFIVPYNNNYGIISHMSASYTGETNGGFFTIKGSPDNIINSKGKILTEDYHATWSVTDDGKFIAANVQQGFILISESGQKYILKSALSNIVDGIGVFTDPNYKKGYKTIKEEWIAKPVYDEAEPFSDGMACVGKKNEFGEMKYGFIDKTGKEVIPFMFSRKPASFYGGIARVEPKDITDFRIAYIDKKGTIVKKFPQMSFFEYFGNGLYSQDLKYTDVMDSTGVIVPKDEFLQKFGVAKPSSEKGNLVLRFGGKRPMYNSGKLTFLRNLRGEINKFGFIDFKTKTSVEGAFENGILSPFVFSDPVSKLSPAVFNTTGKRDKTPLRKGYINEQGIFIIVVKGQTSQF